MTPRVSLAELAAADLKLRPAEAVTVVIEVCRQYLRGEIPGIPSPGIIRVTRDGEVSALGPMTREEATVSRAGHLLNDLLTGDNAPAHYRASGGLRLVIARALGVLDLPPFAGLEEFCAALARFAGHDPGATARELYRRWEARLRVLRRKIAAPALTMSAILQTDVNHEDEPECVTALVPSGPQRVARLDLREPRRSGPIASVLALVVAALLALGAIAIVMGSAQRNLPARTGTIDAGAGARNSVESPLPVPGAKGTAPVRTAAPIVSAAAAAPAPLPESRSRATRPRVRPAPRTDRETPHNRSFLNRELIRIDIK